MHAVPPAVVGPTRSILTPPPVRVERLHGGRPVLAPVAAHPWESGVVLNPAAVLVEGARLAALLPGWGLTAAAAERLRAVGGAVVMLYRAQGAVDPAKGLAPSSLGRAVFTPTLELVHRDPAPALRPDAPFHNLGLEDPRCTEIGGVYHLVYTGYLDATPDDPYDRRVQICTATSTDLAAWTLHGPLPGDLNAVNNKNAVLLPEPVDGRFLMLHRPMEGADAMAVHWADAPDPAGPWTTRGLLFRSFPYAEFAQSWVGAGGPPVPLGDGRFLAVYHQGHYAADGAREYDLAAALIDARHPEPVRARIEPLLRPAGDLETEGDDALGVDNVVFSCANHVWQGDLVIPYAGADSRIFGARVPLVALVRALEAQAGGGANGHANGRAERRA